MLDINFIRNNKELVKKAVESKKSNVDIDKLLRIDQEKRQLQQQVDELRQQRNLASREQNIESGKSLKNELGALEKQLGQLNNEFLDLLWQVPNIPLPDVPFGRDETENQVIRKWGEPAKLSFTPKDHLELGESLGIIDTQTAAKVSGSRFAYLKGAAATLEFAIVQFVFKVLQDEDILKQLAAKIEPGFSHKPFIPVVPPVIVRPEVFRKMARLDPSVEEERYFLPKDDLYLVGSAEHTLGPMHMDEVLNESDLPLRYIGFSTSFRREAGSYGKDVKGILRVHQFDKLEMESFTSAKNSLKEQDFIVSIQEYLLQQLNIPYQVVMICTGDMGGPDARQIDIESWIPSQGKYRETHTSDLMTDYQARRLNTKFKKLDGKIEYVHTNDATAFAIGRILVAILENYQQADGSVKVPEILKKYTGFSEITKTG